MQCFIQRNKIIKDYFHNFNCFKKSLNLADDPLQLTKKKQIANRNKRLNTIKDQDYDRKTTNIRLNKKSFNNKYSR